MSLIHFIAETFMAVTTPLTVGALVSLLHPFIRTELNTEPLPCRRVMLGVIDCNENRARPLPPGPTVEPGETEEAQMDSNYNRREEPED